MKKKISEISGYFKIEQLKNDKRIIVFFVCLFIATALWFLNALNKDYSTTISLPVKYVSPPKNQFLSNTPPSKLDLKVNAHGFTLLRHKLGLSFSPIVLNINNVTNNFEVGYEGYRINSNRLIRQVSDQVSSEISISGILPDVFYIKLDSLKTKTVPVKTEFQLNFKPQFNLKDPVSVQPPTVEIKGPAAVLDTIFFLSLEEKKFENLDADFERLFNVNHPENTIINPGKVTVKIPVEKFTEKEITIPVQIQNKPKNKNVKLFPSEIKLTVLVGLSAFEDIEASTFQVAVDYNEVNSQNEELKIVIQQTPSNVQIIRYAPESVEYLIETN